MERLYNFVLCNVSTILFYVTSLHSLSEMSILGNINSVFPVPCSLTTQVNSQNQTGFL